ncbi:hypothetical protein [Caldivirga maquilingensis]|uniref:hypothetical protein n=1 Tax=Caldivirga maquilingensis TaxID=76887 RepID=UPI0012E9E8B9|nr:hypothetical protein [Caldivirga maquilingensis]
MSNQGSGQGTPISESPLTPLERLQLMVPGFRGYKVKDLIRQDDFLVRKAVTQILEEARSIIEANEAAIAQTDPFNPIIQQYEALLSELRKLIMEVYNAPLGDSGMHDRFKVYPEDLENLVKYDLALINSAKSILEAAKSSQQPQAIMSLVREARGYFTERQKLLLPSKLRT